MRHPWLVGALAVLGVLLAFLLKPVVFPAAEPVHTTPPEHTSVPLVSVTAPLTTAATRSPTTATTDASAAIAPLPITQDELNNAATVGAAYVTAMYSHSPTDNRDQATTNAQMWSTGEYRARAIADLTRDFPTGEATVQVQTSARLSAPVTLLTTPNSVTLRWTVQQTWTQEGKAGERAVTAQVGLSRDGQRWLVNSVTGGEGDAGHRP